VHEVRDVEPGGTYSDHRVLRGYRNNRAIQVYSAKHTSMSLRTE
jgi:hypothetical protein